MSTMKLSEIIIQSHEASSFVQLMQLVNQLGKGGLVLIEFDLKPDFPDTPRDWQNQLEIAFTAKR